MSKPDDFLYDGKGGFIPVVIESPEPCGIDQKRLAGVLLASLVNAGATSITWRVYDAIYKATADIVAALDDRTPYERKPKEVAP